MRLTTPPFLATRFLEHSGVSEPLVGDLVEQYRQGRSGVWSWRQAVLAIVLTVTKDIRDHQFLAARVLVVSSAVFFALRTVRNLV